MKKTIVILLGLIISLCAFAEGYKYEGGVLVPVGRNPVPAKKSTVKRIEPISPTVAPHCQLVQFTDNLTFTIGEDSQAFTSKRELNPFEINKFETTYGLWYDVRVKSEQLGYVYNNIGQSGSHGKRGAMPNESNGTQPVSMISWYDAIVWCNAYSELCGLTPCYSYNGKVLRDSTDTAACDLSICNWYANGYRLPSEAEWEYAARRIAGRATFQPGNLASGQLEEDTSPNQETALLYSWTYENAGASRVVGTAGIPFDPNNISKMGTGNTNKAGLFDMTGNSLEYCWDWYDDYRDNAPYGPAKGAERVSRGGSWSEYTPFMFAGDRYSFDPNVVYPYMGFRIARSILK